MEINTTKNLDTSPVYGAGKASLANGSNGTGKAEAAVRRDNAAAQGKSVDNGNPAVELTRDEYQEISNELNKFMQSLNTDIQFEIHEGTGQMMVKVVDIKENRVLKEFPPKELLDTIAAIRDYVGALLDKRA